ncbi:hypothetical protein ACFOZY_02460 [Chungangia koreensis]|uniref:Uncharacterized protein n=1 Tax=Chungangia koreensis TaxID=752657 RepID=A0ABV8X1W3_9LACT
MDALPHDAAHLASHPIFALRGLGLSRCPAGVAAFRFLSIAKEDSNSKTNSKVFIKHFILIGFNIDK